MIAGLVVLIIILGCAVYQYFKGTFVRAFATIIIAVCAGIAAFSFFEVLANVFISRSDTGRFIAIVPWAQPLCFALIFIIVFGILQTGIVYLTHQKPVDLGFLPERIGRVICGIFLGLLLSGFLLTTLGMAPLPEKYPYQRFDGKRNKVLLNPDGLATGLFGTISKGSFSGTRSFSAIHPDFLDQIHLNRQFSDSSVVTSRTPAISLPKPTEPAVWPATDSLNEKISQIVSDLNRQSKIKDDSSGKFISMPALVSNDYQPTIVRIGINRTALSAKASTNGGQFLLTQIRLICKPQGYDDETSAGTGINVYPIGHLKAADQIQVSTEIKLDVRDDFNNNAREKWIDFVFCVPRGYVPAVVQFKQNSIVEISPRSIVTADKAPTPALYTYTPKSKPAQN